MVSAELGVALHGFDARPLAAAGDSGAHTEHVVALRRRGGVALLAHSVHAEHGEVGFAAGGFMRKFAKRLKGVSGSVDNCDGCGQPWRMMAGHGG